MTDVVVVGAGISGAAAALELAEAGFSVVLLDRWGPAAMASGWTLAGVRQSGRHPAELPLARAAVQLWETLSERLGAETQYRQEGNLRLARTEAELPVIERLVADQAAAGLDVSLVEGETLRDLAPALNPGTLAACYCPSDGHADPIATVQALVEAAIRAGATCRFGERALAVERDHGRVAAIRTDKGRIPCRHAVLAAGIFGNELLEPLGASIPIVVRLVAVMRTAPLPPMLRQVIGVANADCAGRQQADGRFRATSGGEDFRGIMRDGARPSVLPPAGTLRRVVETFGTAVPAFASAPVEDVWAGLIDLTPDALPVLDTVPGADGLAVAMGFSGHGFCLGPVTGTILSDLICGKEPRFDLMPFRLGRFAHWNAPSEPITLHG